MKKDFRAAGDLIDVPNLNNPVGNKISKQFRTPGDLNNKNVSYHEEYNFSLTNDELQEYLKSIVSGVVYEKESELGTLCGGGSMIVTFSQLQEMVDEGSYNIIKAEFFNPEMISIVYQKYDKRNVRKF